MSQNRDLTAAGAAVFNELYHRLLVYTDKNDDKSAEWNSNVKILEKFYAKICKEKEL